MAFRARGKMAARALLALLCFSLCITQQFSRYFVNEQRRNESRYTRSLYFKINKSLSNIQPDGDGFRWCISRDNNNNNNNNNNDLFNRSIHMALPC